MGATLPVVRLRYRLVIGGTIAIGPGKADLLAALAESGSIAGAARAMGMSYKKAWYLLDTMNHAFREPVIEAAKGGRARGGATLTPMGDRVLALYRRLETKAAASVADEITGFSQLLAEVPGEPD